MLVRPAPPQHYGEMARILGLVPTPGFRAIEAVDAAGQVRGFVALDGWTRNAAQAHMAAQTPIAWRSLLRPAFDWAFRQCDRGVLLGLVAANNERSVRLCRRFGFSEAYRVRDGHAPGVDLLLFEMRREDCRFLERERKVA